MRLVYFVSNDDVKKYTPININVEESLVRKAILDAQHIKLQELLGSELYNKIEDLVISGMTEDVNADYKTLYDDHIYNCTIQWTLVEILPYVRFKIVNKSVTLQNSENSTPAEFEEFKYFIALLTNKAEFYSKRMKDYLKANYTLFPEYNFCTGCDNGELKPSKGAYFSGIEFY